MKAASTTLAALAVALSFSAAAAQDTTQVRTDMSMSMVAGTWELVEVDGSPLPVTAEENEECTETVTAGTLSLHEDGQWDIELIEMETCGTETRDDTETEEGEYVLEGHSINFRPDEDPMDPPVEEVEEEVQSEEQDMDEIVSGTMEQDMEEPVIRVRTRGEAELVFRRVEG